MFVSAETGLVVEVVSFTQSGNQDFYRDVSMVAAGHGDCAVNNS